MSPSVPVVPTQRPESVCERWRSSLIEHYGGKPEPKQYLPQCEPDGQFRYTHKHTHTTKNNRLNSFFNDKLLLNCLSVQSSVMERRLTAGVWTRTAGRFPALDHMMSSNLHVSIYWYTCTTCLSTWWTEHKLFLSLLSCPRSSLGGPAHRAPTAPPRCDPSHKRWHHTAVRSGTENRGVAVKRYQTGCNPGQNTVDSTCKRWTDKYTHIVLIVCSQTALLSIN